MTNYGITLFLICAFVAVLTAVGTVMLQNPIRAAVSLLAHIVSLAALYLSLHAHFLAAIQLMVYAGAVVVLFVFVIMLIGPVEIPSGETRGLVGKAFALAMMAIITAMVSLTLLDVTPKKIPMACPPGAPDCDLFGGVQGLGREMFQQGVVPFELISVLLTVAIVGAIAVARGRTAKEAAAHQRKVDEQASAAAQMAGTNAR
jgi:NADH-quinone oxidoreductase subunit J